MRLFQYLLKLISNPAELVYRVIDREFIPESTQLSCKAADFFRIGFGFHFHRFTPPSSISKRVDTDFRKRALVQSVHLWCLCYGERSEETLTVVSDPIIKEPDTSRRGGIRPPNSG